MTVYPIIFNVGPLQITGYGIMMMIGFLMGGWLIGLELKRRGLREDYAGEIVVAAVIGGIVGAKLWYVFLMGDPRALFSRGGLVWYGGFLGGTLAVILNGLRLKIPTRWTAQLMGPPLAAAYALGRVGCFLVNDDYGRPTEVAWAVKFPQGMPPSTAGNMERMFGIAMPQGMDPTTVLAVHPTQVRSLPDVCRRRALRYRIPARQGRPNIRRLHPGSGDQRGPGTGWSLSRVRTLPCQGSVAGVLSAGGVEERAKRAKREKLTDPLFLLALLAVLVLLALASSQKGSRLVPLRNVVLDPGNLRPHFRQIGVHSVE